MTINVDAAPDSTEINPTTPIMTTTTPATTDVATLADWVKSAQFNDPEFQKIVRQFHDAPDVCHLSQEETARAIRTQYTWPALSADVRQHVRACPVCVTKRGPIKARAPLQDGLPKKSSRRGRKTRPNKPSAPTTPGKSNNPGRLQRREPAHAEYVACAPQQRPPEETPEKTPKNNLGQQLPRQIGGDAEETRKGTTRTNCVDRGQNRASKGGERDTALREFSPDHIVRGPCSGTIDQTPLTPSSTLHRGVPALATSTSHPSHHPPSTERSLRWRNRPATSRPTAPPKPSP
ncbi:hypothetical protein GEV33_006051 [Tenebrio molitor]|jgi:hypothetical protein|uniref:Integrase zinc-binding domain-containing protein n=1 Tax=Tenebrio molitor TaxID=7067 RepID=A0A8J6LDI4_TENMO|nr:hypothetical protein GEV33_006051 [Tenebrio molitor]